MMERRYTRKDGTVAVYVYDETEGFRACVAQLTKGHTLTLDPVCGSRGWQFANLSNRRFSHRTIAALLVAGVAIRDGNIVRLA